VGDGRVPGAPDPTVAPGSIAAVKRIPAGLLAAVAVLAMGALASACEVTPDAATVNGDSVSVSTINARMNALAQSTTGRCFYAASHEVDLTAAQGAGGSGTYVNQFAKTVVGDQVGFLLTAQYAASLGIRLSAAELSSAESNYTAVLDGEIGTYDQNATAAGAVSLCQKSDGTAYTGQELLSTLPAEVRNDQISNFAVEQQLLAHGADLSDAAVLNYYVANTPQFTTACISVIATASQADADAVVTKLKGGASFSALAASSSTDPQSAANGGALGCTFTEARVLEALGLTAVTVGKPVTPIQASGGVWEVFEVTSLTPTPVTEAAPQVRQAILYSSTNTRRLSTDLQRFGRHSAVTVNPQYGTWSAATLGVVSPPSPATRYLLPAYASTSAGAGASSVGASSSAGSGGTTTTTTIPGG